MASLAPEAPAPHIVSLFDQGMQYSRGELDSFLRTVSHEDAMSLCWYAADKAQTYPAGTDQAKDASWLALSAKARAGNHIR